MVLLDQFEQQNQTDSMHLFRYLNSHLKQPITVLSLDYDPNFKDHLMSWAKHNQLNVPNMVNVFTEIQSSAQSTAPVITIHENPNLKGNWDKTGKYREYRDDQGNLMMVAAFRNKDQIQAIRYYDNNKIIKISTLNDQGQLSRNRNLNGDGTPLEDKYYRIDGTLALRTAYAQNQLSKVEVYDNNSLKIHTFDSMDSFNYWWLKSYLQAQADFVLIGFESDDIYHQLITTTNITALPYLTDFTQNGNRLKAVLHSNHPWRQVLVPNLQSKLMLEDAIDRDINISYVNTNGAIALPKRLETADEELLAGQAE